MSVERFIALRYLLSKHKINFVTIISIISILGITIGVAALIVVLSVFNGFSSLVKNILINFDPHIKIESTIPGGFTQSSQIENYLRLNKNIDSFSPYVNGKVVIYSNKVIRIVELNGITSDSTNKLSGLKDNIVLGQYDLSKKDFPKILIGLSLATSLRVSVGDTLTLVSPEGFENVLTLQSLPLSKQFIVSGIYSSHNKEIDAVKIYCDLNISQQLLGYGKNILGYEIRLKDINQTNSVKKELQKIIDKNSMDILTWFDLHKQLYSVMLIERWVAYTILSLIIAVATFSIFSSLFMTVLEKKREIGVLKSLGMSNNSILKIFLLEGFLIGIIGAIVGSILGIGICYLQVKFKIYGLDPTVYIIDSLPIELHSLDVILITLMAIILATLAGYFPAKKAARMLPIESIKWE